MELRWYLAIIKRHWRPLAVIPLVAALVAFAATYAIAPRYESQATVQLIPDDVEPRTVTLRSQDGPSSSALGLKDPTELLAQTVIENLGSRAVTEQIVDQIGMDRWPDPQGFAALKAQAQGLLYDTITFAQHGYVVRISKREGAIRAVENALNADLVRGSYYINITATWSDPEIATEIANLAVQALNTHMRAVANQAGNEQSTFFKTQMDTARQQMQDARERLLDYSRSSGTVGDTSLGQALDAREQARSALQQNSLDLAATKAQAQTLQQQIDSTSPTIVTGRTVSGINSTDSGASIESTGPNPAWDEAKQQVQQLEQEVSALETRGWYDEAEFKASIQTQLADARRRLQVAYDQQKQGDKLPELVRDSLREQVLTLEQQVAALESMLGLSFEELKLRNGGILADTRRRLEVAQQQLAGTPAQVRSGQRYPSTRSSTSSTTETSSANPVYQDLLQRSTELTQQISAMEALQTKLSAALQDREADLRQRTAQDGQLAVLNQELALASDRYIGRVSQWNDSLLEAARPANQTRLVNAAVLPLYPSQPIKYRWAIIGMAAGLALATIYVFVRHNTDLRVRTPDEAEEALGLGLLVVVPADRALTP